jgi:hypothetical protein
LRLLLTEQTRPETDLALTQGLALAEQTSAKRCLLLPGLLGLRSQTCVLLGQGVVVRLQLGAGSTKARSTAWACACGPDRQTATASVEQLVLELRELALTAWGQEVLLASHELLRGLLRRLRHILLTERGQRLSACRRGKLLTSDVCDLLILTLPEQSLADLTNAEVRLGAQVLACDAAKALICGLAKVLLAKAKQPLRRLPQRRELLLRLRGLRQPTACQAQEAVLHRRELWV